MAFPCQWEGYIITKRTISGKESACQYKETQAMGVQFLGQKDPLEKEMATHSSILAWEIPWEPGRLQFVGSQSQAWPSD